MNNLEIKLTKAQRYAKIATNTFKKTKTTFSIQAPLITLPNTSQYNVVDNTIVVPVTDPSCNNIICLDESVPYLPVKNRRNYK